MLLGAMVLCLVALFFSSSKTMWITIISTLLLFSWLKKSRVVLMGATVLVGLVVIAAGVRPQVREMGTHILNFANAPSMQERYLGWGKSYFMFLDNPLFGVGPKAFGGAKNQYQVSADFGQAHNLVLHGASEMGLLAFSFGLKLMPTLWGRIVPGQRLRSLRISGLGGWGTWSPWQSEALRNQPSGASILSIYGRCRYAAKRVKDGGE